MLLRTLLLFLLVALLAWGPAIYARITQATVGIAGPLAEAGSVATFIPEVWAKSLLTAVEKALVIAAPGVVNRDWEGEIAEAGDTVHINSVGDPTIDDYIPNVTTITPEKLTTAQRSLVVDQSKYFAFEVDDVDRRQARGDLISTAMRRAAYKLRDVADRYVRGLMWTGVAADNVLANGAAISVTEGSPKNFYDKVLVPLSVKLDEADIPTEGRFALIPPWAHGRLLLDDRFIRSDASGATKPASLTGWIGEAAGFTLRKSNNLDVITGDDYPVIAGVDAATTYAEQVNKTEAYRPESSFSDAVKGLHVYGAKVVRPDHLAAALVSQT